MFEEEELRNSWRFGRFAILHYIPAFLSSSSGRDAAFNDLQLYKALLKYLEVDRELAESAIATLNRHLWYLAPQTVLFALFSNKVSEDHKSRMACRLLTLDRKESPILSVPKFPVLTAETELCDLITEESWDFSAVVNSNPLPWLTTRVSGWESYADYNKVKAFVSTAKVVNDCAERAVALATDYYKVLIIYFILWLIISMIWTSVKVY